MRVYRGDFKKNGGVSMYFDDIMDSIDKGELTDLRDLKGTASLVLTNTSALVIYVCNDTVLYQYFGETKGEIEVTDLEYFSYSDEIGDILNVDAEEFENEFGGVVPGFKVGDNIYLIDEFIRDDFGI